MKKKTLVLLVTILAFLMQTLPAFADQSSQEELTLKKAMQRAYAHSVNLRNTEMDLEINDINLDNLRWSMNGILTGYNIPDQQDKDIHRAFFGADLQYRVTEKKLDNIKRQIKIDVTNAYYNVLLAEQEIKTSNMKLAQTLIKHSQVHSKYDVGMATQMDILSAQAQFEADKVALEDKNNNLTKAYSQLNKLVGNQQDARPKLTDTIQYSPVEDLDVDTYVLKSINNSYEIWSAEEAAKTARNLKYYETFYDIGDYNEAQAKNTLSDARESIRLQSRTLCLAIINMQNQYSQMEVQEKQLQEALRTTTVQHQVGMITKDVLDGVALSLAQVKTGKEQLAVTHTKAVGDLQRLTGELNTIVE